MRRSITGRTKPRRTAWGNNWIRQSNICGKFSRWGRFRSRREELESRRGSEGIYWLVLRQTPHSATGRDLDLGTDKPEFISDRRASPFDLASDHVANKHSECRGSR